MRRLFHFLMNNIREHFMLYVILWSLLAVMDIVISFSSDCFSLTLTDTS
ncbi:DUF2770 domain-containing protein [Salmonella enterica]|nr:DUF2770 domain-containing protein [Salmonella enterica]EAR1624315.1 DUF2770 domain-containing protein [Salmonella enterica]EAT7656428.1 DUF2770 domain-containing protein [Salmonella enterica]EAU9788700.1 DUF2770 domain-containing protein [Salmonella enterica]EAY4263920.1 DUF2770 domain-containing protein [Salmonella enterica]